MTTLIKKIKGQSVLFITTKNLDYLRNTQEIELLKEHAATVHIIGSSSASYPRRLLSVWTKLLLTSMKQYSVVFIGFAPQLIVPFFSCKFRRAFLIEDFFISFYDTLVYDRQKFSPQSLTGRLLYLLDRYTIRRAGLIISDTKAHGHYFASEFSPKGMQETLYLKADTTIYYPRPTRPSQGFHVLYFGSVLPLQGLPVILDAIRLLQDKGEIYFTIIGPIPAKWKKPADSHIRYFSWLSQEALAEEIAGADLCLAGHFHGTIPKARRTIPGKAYIYEAMEKPMILGDNPASRERDTAWKVPVFYVPMGDSQALADCILHCFASYSSLRT